MIIRNKSFICKCNLDYLGCGLTCGNKEALKWGNQTREHLSPPTPASSSGWQVAGSVPWAPPRPQVDGVVIPVPKWGLKIVAALSSWEDKEKEEGNRKQTSFKGRGCGNCTYFFHRVHWWVHGAHLIFERGWKCNLHLSGYMPTEMFLPWKKGRTELEGNAQSVTCAFNYFTVLKLTLQPLINSKEMEINKA